MEILEIAVKQPLTLKIGDTDYVVEFPLSAVINLEGKLLRGMKSAADWFRIQTKELPEVLRAGLQARHKDEADAVVEAIDGALGPEQIETVIDAICTANWPDATRRYKEELEKLRERVRKGLPLPNVPSADAL